VVGDKLIHVNGICKLKLVGAQLLIAKSKVGIVFEVEF